MSEAEEVKFDIKVVLNKEKTKVLFAESGSDFTDVLLSFLVLPLGMIVKVLKKHYGDEAPVIGSLNTLYNGVENLDSVHFSSDSRTKNMLLNPSSTIYEFLWHGLKLDITCKHWGRNKAVFAKSAASFIISDDLQLMPNVAGSVIKALRNLNIAMTDMEEAETRIVSFGFSEFMALLKELLTSQKALAADLLHLSPINLAKKVKQEQGSTLLNPVDEMDISRNNKKMVLNVMLEKSSNKLLFAQTDADFINFLFGMLTLPLGIVGRYLGGNTGLQSIDNLYGSIAADSLHHHVNQDLIEYYLLKSSNRSPKYSTLNFDSNNDQNHVNRSRMYMVSDDLTVTPLGITSSISVINELKISLSNVEELEVQVGLEDGLSILKAALTSTTALTDGLIKPMLKKQPMQEG